MTSDPHTLSNYPVWVRVKCERALVQLQVDPPVAPDAVPRRRQRLLHPGLVDGGLRPLLPAESLPEDLVCGQLLPDARREAEVRRVQVGQHGERDLGGKVGDQVRR